VSLEGTNLDAVLRDGMVVILSRMDDPNRASIELLPSQWEAFRSAIKAGAYDRLPRRGEGIGWPDGPQADALRRGI
jgi:hypothetical protein